MSILSSLITLPLIIIHLITANPGEDASRQVNITWHASQSGTKLYLTTIASDTEHHSSTCNTEHHSGIIQTSHHEKITERQKCLKGDTQTVIPSKIIEINPTEELWSYDKGDSLFQQPRYICRVKLDSLQPGTKYYYSIARTSESTKSTVVSAVSADSADSDCLELRSRNSASTNITEICWRSFTTASGPQTKEWSFLAFADFQHPFNETTHKTIAAGLTLTDNDSHSSRHISGATNKEATSAYSDNKPSNVPAGNTEGPASLHSNTHNNASSSTGNNQLLLCSGDITGTAANESEWRWALDNPVMSDLIFAGAPGDHEYWGIKPEGEKHIPQMPSNLTYNAILTNPQNGCPEYRNSNYYFYYNNVLFVSLNCGDSNTYLCPQFIREADWFRKTILPLKGTYDYLVVFGHKSIYGSYQEDSGVRKYFTPLWYPVFDQAGVDLVVSGHDHMYSRTFALKGDARVSAKGSGTWYLDLGSSGNKYRSPDEGLYKDGLHAKVFDLKTNPKTLGAKIFVSEKEMKVIVFDENGETFDSFTILKK